MSSLAFYAAPIEEVNNKINDGTTIDKKRESKMNKTLKRRPANRSHVQAMIDQIHQSTGTEEESGLASFDPPAPPESVGAARRESREGSGGPAGYSSPDNGTFQDAPVTTEAFDGLPSTNPEDYYQRVVPFYNKVNQGPSQGQNKDELLTKLNYMIHLLEEQQEERTGHVTEEVVLYSFLGVFIIFVVDSFARAGKYVR